MSLLLAGGTDEAVLNLQVAAVQAKGSSHIQASAGSVYEKAFQRQMHLPLTAVRIA